MRVSDVMSTPVRTISVDQSADEAWEAMRLHGTHHLVVTDGDGRVAGVVSDTDLGGKNGEPIRSGRTVRDLMTEKVVTATPDTTVREAANLMRGHGIDCLPVLDGSRVKGVVTSLDLLELIGRGAERPVAKPERRVLKNRGQLPETKNASKRAASSVSPGRRSR
jgi:acetoin utilization protein AcuB